MSLISRWVWICDGCDRAVPDDGGAAQEGDVLTVEGWIHTIMGDDLCPLCQP